jgi:hypothetical protein
MEQKYRAVKDYQINIDYDIDKLMSIVENIFLGTGEKSISEYRNQILDGSDDFDDFKKKTPLMGTRTTLENELKISDTEALNYLMDFPLNFNLEPLVKMLFDDAKPSFFIIQEEDRKHIVSLKLNFDDKKKLISQNFESRTHIDIQEFLAWAESKGFIKKNPIS